MQSRRRGSPDSSRLSSDSRIVEWKQEPTGRRDQQPSGPNPP